LLSGEVLVMKQLMKIIGVKLVNLETVELILTPKEMVKPKTIGIMDLAGGNLEQLMQKVGSNQRFETKIYRGLNQDVEEIKNQPFTDVWVEVTVETFASDLVGGKKK